MLEDIERYLNLNTDDCIGNILSRFPMITLMTKRITFEADIDRFKIIYDQQFIYEGITRRIKYNQVIQESVYNQRRRNRTLLQKVHDSLPSMCESYILEMSSQLRSFIRNPHLVDGCTDRYPLPFLNKKEVLLENENYKVELLEGDFIKEAGQEWKNCLKDEDFRYKYNPRIVAIYKKEGNKTKFRKFAICSFTRNKEEILGPANKELTDQEYHEIKHIIYSNNLQDKVY